MQEERPIPRAVQVFGWYGTIAIVSAFGLSNEGLLAQGMLYQLLNLTGAIGVALLCWYQRTWQAFWVEAFWSLLALKALL